MKRDANRRLKSLIRHPRWRGAHAQRIIASAALCSFFFISPPSLKEEPNYAHNTCPGLRTGRQLVTTKHVLRRRRRASSVVRWWKLPPFFFLRQPGLVKFKMGYGHFWTCLVEKGRRLEGRFVILFFFLICRKVSNGTSPTPKYCKVWTNSVKLCVYRLSGCSFEDASATNGNQFHFPVGVCVHTRLYA